MSLALLACVSNFAGDSGAQTETAAVTLDGVSGVISITEGDAAFGYNISLAVRPSSVVWVAPRIIIKGGKYSARIFEKLRVEPPVAAFKPEDWIGNEKPSKTFQLIAPEDYIAEETRHFLVKHSIASAAPEYSAAVAEIDSQDDSVGPATLEVDVIDNDSAAVAMTQSSFKSVGGMVKGVYAVGLRSEPLSPVAVMLSSDGLPITFEPSTIYFTSRSWHKPVQVHFEAQNTSAPNLEGARVLHSSESRDVQYDYRHCTFLPSDSFTPFIPGREIF